MKILWVGDAVVDTGFSRVTHNICERLIQRGHEVNILGVNYYGDPHPHPFRIYVPSLGQKEDIWGFDRIWPLTKAIKPDVVSLLNDPYVIAQYLQNRPADLVCPVVAYVPIDGKNVREDIALTLCRLDGVIFYTEFGRKEASKSGFVGQSWVIPHGVDPLYGPKDRLESRKRMGLPPSLHDAFLFGNINRNQPRKRLDLTVEYFAEFLKRTDAGNAYLYLHCTEEDLGIRPGQLCKYYGIDHRLIMPSMESLNPAKGVSQELLCHIYSSLDVQITTTSGEGFGLSTIEGMACGIPNIIPDWAALGEWPRGQGCRVIPCTSTWCFPGGVNTVGGLPDRDRFVQAMIELYGDAEVRAQLGREARKRSTGPEFDWDNITDQFVEVFKEVVP